MQTLTMKSKREGMMDYGRRISCTHSVGNKLEIQHVSLQMYMFLLTYLNQALYTIVLSLLLSNGMDRQFPRVYID